jgi:hypothetical protein
MSSKVPLPSSSPSADPALLQVTEAIIGAPGPVFPPWYDTLFNTQGLDGCEPRRLPSRYRTRQDCN